MGEGGTTNYGINLNNKGLTRNQGRKFLSFSGRNSIIPKENGYKYVSGIVEEVISDPKSFFSDTQAVNNFYDDLEPDQKKSDANNAGEQNLVHKVPKNSIICKLIDNSKQSYVNKSIVCFPFFSPHVALPIKTGEHVWILQEVFDDFPRYYWMSRKHGSYYNDNINITSHEREISIYSKAGLSEGINAFTQADITDMHSFPNTESNNNFDISYSRKKELTNEPVPEVVKKCGDLVLQGSNNATIHLTTEKFMNPEDCNKRYDKNAFLVGEINEDADRTPMSPAIDICVLRKKKHLVELLKKVNSKEEKLNYQIEEKNTLSIVENNREGNKSVENYEINKFEEDYYSNKDKDPANCGSRLYMSNNCDIDSIFKLSDTEKSQEIFQQYGGATLAGYSEHIRFIAEGESSSFRVVKKHTAGETFLEIDNDGMVRIGSKEGNAASEGGVSGMQPFVKGGELELLLNRLIDEIGKMIDSINETMLTNISPGFGVTNLTLSTKLPPALTGHKVEFNKVKNDLKKFKSKLIKGE